MDEPIGRAVERTACSDEKRTGRRLIVGTLDDLPGAARALDDLRLVGFTPGEITLVARVDGTWRAEAVAAERIRRLGDPSTVACRGLGTLIIGGGAVPTLGSLGAHASLDELGRAFAVAGLPDADALIYELGLIRGQCFLAVRTMDAEREQIAYRLLLRCGSAEVHVYRS
jgi:hypothetical protein